MNCLPAERTSADQNIKGEAKNSVSNSVHAETACTFNTSNKMTAFGAALLQNDCMHVVNG
jgi:hypothetical protein